MKYSNCKVHFLMGIISFVSIITAALGEAVDYSGYKIYKAGPLSPVPSDIFRTLAEKGYDIFGTENENFMNILVSPNQKNEFESMMRGSNITTEVVTKDLSSVLEREKRSATITNNTNFNFDYFPRYHVMIDILRNMVNGSKYARMIKIGESFEGRPIIGIRLRSSFYNPVIFVDAGLHAREWAAPMTALYLIKKIIEEEEIFANRATIYIIPCANPDGYEFSHTDDRFWRKSRSTSNSTSCIGVDINRNFDSYWGEYGISWDPCSYTFPGTSPFTESEANAIANAILKTYPEMYLTLHSYGPLLLYPWGFTTELPENWEELDQLARNATAALKKVTGQEYIIGSSTNVLYAASGGSDDWAMQKANVSLVYTMELPQYGTGFIVPVEKIIPMGEETFAAFDVFVRYVCSRRHEKKCD